MKRPDTAWPRQERIVGGAPLQFQMRDLETKAPAVVRSPTQPKVPRGQLLALRGTGNASSDAGTEEVERADCTCTRDGSGGVDKYKGARCAACCVFEINLI